MQGQSEYEGIKIKKNLKIYNYLIINHDQTRIGQISRN